MTITASSPTYVQIPGNSSATVFAAPMKCFAATDVLVGFIVGGTYLLQVSGYTVTNIDVNGGFTVSFGVAPPTGTTVDIRTQTPQTQPTEFANLGAYLPENTTEACDRLTRALQDAYRQTYTFGIHGPDQEATPWPALPAAAARAGGNLIFDATTGLPEVGFSTSANLTQAIFNGFLVTSTAFPWPITSDEAAALVTPTSYFYPPGNLLRYGADPTGVADSTAAIKAAAAVHAIAHREIIVDGIFLYTPTARIDVSGVWRGSGKVRSAIRINTSSYGSAAVYSGAIASSADYFRVSGHGMLRDLTIQATTGTGVGTGIYLSADPDSGFTGDIRLSGVQSIGFNIGLYLGNVFDVLIDRCDIELNNYGEYCVPNPAGGGFANAITHLNTNIQSNGVNVYFNSSVNCNAIAYYNSPIEDATGTVLIGGLSIGAYFNNVNTVAINEGYTEGTAVTYAYYFAGVSDLKFSGLVNEGTGSIFISNTNTKANLRDVQSAGTLLAAGSSTPVALVLTNCLFPASGNTFNAATTVIQNSTINVSPSTALVNQIGAAPTLAAGIAPPANGNVNCGVLVSSTANLGFFFGTGAPTFSAAEGSLYSNIVGAAGARLYTNTSAGSGTTWTAAASP